MLLCISYTQAAVQSSVLILSVPPLGALAWRLSLKTTVTCRKARTSTSAEFTETKNVRYEKFD